MNFVIFWYSKTCVKRPLSQRPKIGFQDQLSLYAGQKYCRILSTFIKLPFVIKIFVFFYFWVAFLHSFYCNDCKQFLPISDQTTCWSLTGFKLLTLWWCSWIFFAFLKKLILKKNLQMTKYHTELPSMQSVCNKVLAWKWQLCRHLTTRYSKTCLKRPLSKRP